MNFAAKEMGFSRPLSDIEDGRNQSEEWKPRKQEFAVMITIAIVSLMVALDATILVPVLPTLALDLGGSATDAFWAGTSYLLTCAVFQPFIASLSDIFGRKEILLLSIFIFTLGTALCAPVATNFTVLFAGRSLQGIGGGGIITMGQVIYADVVPLRQRPKYFAIVLGAWALGSVLGPLLGGLFVEHLSWRWCFYVNFPFCLLGFILVPIFVKLSPQKSSLASKLRRVDWVGSFFFIGGTTSFLIGLSWAGIQYDWLSIQTIVPMATGVASVVVSMVWEGYGAREPMLRLSLFCSSSAIAAYACAFCQGFLLFCALYYLPFFFIAVQFKTPMQSGLNLLPVTCLLLPGSIVVSILTSRLGRFRWAVWIGWAITSAGCGLLVLFDQDTTTAMWAGILAVFGVGNGMVLTSVNVAIQAISHVEDCGRAAAMYAFMRTMGMSIGVAVGGTTFQNVMSSKLQDLGLPEAIALNAEGFVEQLASLKPTDATRLDILRSYEEGFHGVFWVMTGCACFGFVASLVIKRHSMDKILDSKFVLNGHRSGADMLKKPEVIDPKVAHTSQRASQTSWVAPDRRVSNMSRLSTIGSTFYIDAEGECTPSRPSLMSRDEDTTPQRPLPMRSPDFNMLSEKTNRPGPHPVARGVASSALEQAPALAFYIAPGNRRVPVDISTGSELVHPFSTSQLSVPKATFLRPPRSAAKTAETRRISNILKRDGF
ncbi:major facilitator superfamily domain-containing protein [Pseudomassariella vexata]|uniref:Major facilitator superfamily domain-containing protein n=1 Tax=Pseudomassariella vexata TaxID=1141098 RepID=A0A1Y2E955_9PEZI|nr:major facilitator superfamily domain-containing protein [Pseudomassariella vexata]ORY67806.1 major facilitator superfamily domain-containing protein [Pseudomassariella vexata]